MTTAAGTWAPTADDAKLIEIMADMEDKWQQVRWRCAVCVVVGGGGRASGFRRAGAVGCGSIFEPKSESRACRDRL